MAFWIGIPLLAVVAVTPVSLREQAETSAVLEYKHALNGVAPGLPNTLEHWSMRWAHPRNPNVHPL